MDLRGKVLSTEERKEIICDLMLEGVPLTDIARQLGMSNEAMGHFAEEHLPDETRQHRKLVNKKRNKGF